MFWPIFSFKNKINYKRKLSQTDPKNEIEALRKICKKQKL